MWYFTDLSRFKKEREDLERLSASADWLTPIRWRSDDAMRLIFDVEITVGTRTFAVALTFPAHFPFTPLSVYPRDDNSRWSSHQFGPGGELCLEYGPDNWTPDRTGVEVLESAHRLLLTENPPTGNPGIVASRHETTLGQELRGKNLRFLITRELKTFLQEMDVGTKLKGNLLVLFRESIIYIVDKITKSDGEVWHNAAVPTTLGKETYEWSVYVVRIPAGADFPSAADLATFNTGLERLGIVNDGTSLVLVRDDEVRGFFVPKDTVTELVTVLPPAEVRRLDEGHDKLRTLRVAIIGCGSLGSKIATMLARSGVCRFFLADDDVLLNDNLVRQDLDWRDVGTHKVDALARRLRNVNPDAKVTVRRLRIAGQESSGSAETAIESLAKRDLIIDATANPDVFNFLAGFVDSVRKPVIWAEVFGGGFGGSIARCRPGIEPSLQMMRRAIENWFGDRDYTPARVTRNYETGGDGIPLIADDADVTSIAAPAARLAIDTLLGREPSHFPHAAYVIGLGPEEKLFSQAFETFPVDLGDAPAAAEKPKLSPEETAAEFAEVIKIFENK